MQQKESQTNWHFYLSLTKSFIRIIAAVFLITGNVVASGLIFILAEVFGLMEEF